MLDWLWRRLHRHFWMTGVTYTRGEVEPCWRCLTCGEYKYLKEPTLAPDTGSDPVCCCPDCENYCPVHQPEMYAKAHDTGSEEG